MALFFSSSGFQFSSLPLHRSSEIQNPPFSKALIRKEISLKASKLLISASVNPYYTVVPIFRCSASSGYSAEDETSPSTRIFIKGLPHSTTEGCLVKTFSHFGKVDRVKIITDKKCGQSLGFAYVWFTSEVSAQLAMEWMNGKFLDGRFIVVAIARPESPTSQCAYDVAPGGLLASMYHLTIIQYGVDQPEEVCIKVFAPRRNPRIPFVSGYGKVRIFKNGNLL